jgi:hypothetical protein
LRDEVIRLNWVEVIQEEFEKGAGERLDRSGAGTLLWPKAFTAGKKNLLPQSLFRPPRRMRNPIAAQEEQSLFSR